MSSDSIISQLSALVAFPSTSDNKASCKEVLEFIKKQFAGYTNCYLHEYESNGYHSLVICNFEWKQADVFLNWHIDVVPPSQENQFEPYIKDGWLYARWSGDMKWWIVILIETMKYIFENNLSQKVGIILSSDEEIGWFNGVKYILDQWWTSNIVLIPDSWDLTTCITAEKWFITITAKSHGKAGHSSRPRLCENPIENLFSFYRALKSGIEKPEELKAPDYRGSTAVITCINAWESQNVIPMIATWTINIRYTQAFSQETLHAFIEKIAKEYTITIEYPLEWALLYSDPSHPLLAKYLEIADIKLWKIVCSQEHWASDARFFAAKWMPVVLHRPTCKNIHWEDEMVKIDDIPKLIEVYCAYIKAL